MATSTMSMNLDLNMKILSLSRLEKAQITGVSWNVIETQLSSTRKIITEA
jgi:hypothetical protein